MTETPFTTLPLRAEADLLALPPWPEWDGRVQLVAPNERAHEFFKQVADLANRKSGVLLKQLFAQSRLPDQIETGGEAHRSARALRWHYNAGAESLSTGPAAARRDPTEPKVFLPFSSSEHQKEIRLFKEQLIEREREILHLRRLGVELTEQKNRLLDEVNACRQADLVQCGMLLAKEHDRVLLYEAHQGRVVDVVGEENAEVIYRSENPDEEPFSQVFHRDQFHRGQLPRVGTRVETFVLMATRTGPLTKVDAPVEEVAPSFEGLGATGQVRI